MTTIEMQTIPTINLGVGGGVASIQPIIGSGPVGPPGPGAAAWAAAQAVVVGTVRQAPDGSWIKSTAIRTTGATFDATEQTFWTAVLATVGTIEKVALDGTSVSTAAGSFGATLMQTYAQDDGRINAKDKRFGTWGSAASITNALDAAENTNLSKGRIVYFPVGPYQHVYEVGNGLSLSGRTSQIHGGGAYVTTAGDWFGTVFKATTQTGPVLDFSLWENPAAFKGRVTHRGFAVRGSGVADATKNNAGIRVKILSSTTFSDIAIADTGGPCLEGVVNAGNAVYLCDFDRITLNTPVGVQTNNVPWLYMNEPNLASFTRIGFRHVGTAASVGLSGAAIIDSPTATAPSGGSIFSDWWFENLQVKDKGTLVSCKGNYHAFRDVRFVDCYKETGATETSYARFNAPGTGDEGGNMWRGFIPGRNPDIALSIDYGIDNRQSYNAFDGVKGRNGYNVVHRGTATPAGVGTFADVIHGAVTLHGSQLFAQNAGVVDQAPTATGIYQNRHIDYCTGAIKGFTVTA